MPRADATLLALAGLCCLLDGNNSACPTRESNECEDEKTETQSSADELQFSIFMGMQYYGPPEPLSTYHAIAAAAKKLAPAPFYISVCCDHNDKGGGAENRTGDPLDGGWITPICRLNDTQGEAVRKGISVLRDAGVHVLHYTHTRLGYWPNGTEMACCHCCENVSYVTRRIQEETSAFPKDGIFNDNVIASHNWQEYYKAITDEVHRSDPRRAMGMNLNCANGDWPPEEHHTTSGCSPVCMQFGHKPSECANCRSPRCANLTQEFFDFADVHIMAETQRSMVDDPHAYEMQLPFPKTVRWNSKLFLDERKH